jgi:hypothetical protein
MNTEYLFGIYQAKRRITDAGDRRRRESGLPVPDRRGGTPQDPNAISREQASLRVFEAVRASVEGVWYFR